MGPSLYTGGPAGAAPKGPPSLRILFVDDESMILQALQRAVGRMRPTWSVDVAPGGAHALSLLARTPADVVVADLHMPDMDGPALLEEVRRSYPAILRYVFSGSAADELGPVSPGLIHRFLPKPFEMRALLEALDLAEGALRGGERGALPRVSAGAG